MFYVINSALSRQWIVVVIVQGVLMMFLDFPFVLSVGYTLTWYLDRQCDSGHAKCCMSKFGLSC